MSTNSENDCNEIIQISNKRSGNTINRMKGKQYKGLTKGILSEKAPRELKAGCTSKFCEKSAVRDCSLFSEENRREIFNEFWKMSWDEKKMYVTDLIECSNRKRICVENSRRSITKRYYLKHHSERVQVCLHMFLSTLGINEKMVRNWTNVNECHGSNRGNAGTTKSASSATVDSNAATANNNSARSAPVSGITLLLDIANETRKLKAVIANYGNRIRALEATIREQEDNAAGITARTNNLTSNNDIKANNSISIKREDDNGSDGTGTTMSDDM